MQQLVVDNISKSFARTVALSAVSFELGVGEVGLLTGGNGAGKSTLLEIISGFTRPSRGTVFISGLSVHLSNHGSNFRSLLKQVGFVSQHSFLYPRLTVEENLLITARCWQLNDAETIVSELIVKLELEKHRKKRIDSCSSGTIRRTSIARALVHSPQLLILDEPLSNLDGGGRELFFQIIIDLKQAGGTALIAAHEADTFFEVYDKQIILEEGRVLSVERRKSATKMNFRK